MVVNHDDADDLVQDVFIKVWKSLANFRNDAQLYTWMYRIATNECITFLNKKKLKNNIPLDDVSYELAESLADSTYFNGDQAQLKLQQALLTLPDKQRLVFNMKYYDDMKYEEISDVLGTSVGALKASFTWQLKKLSIICFQMINFKIVFKPFHLNFIYTLDMKSDMDSKEWLDDYPSLKQVIPNNPFTVPDGYFDELHQRAMSRAIIDGVNAVLRFYRTEGLF
jgi:RNA polymerase sigma factor (sigma-70 family)